MERLRAGAPTPGGSGDAAGQPLRGATPASSLEGGNAFLRGLKRGGAASDSDTSLLAPESALRSNLRRGRSGGPRGASGADLDEMLMEVGRSVLAARRGCA